MVFSRCVTLAVAATVLGCAASYAWPLPTTGIVNPAPHYQRYRRAEYPADKPFFQWWYFHIKRADAHYAFAYCTSLPAAGDTAKAAETEGGPMATTGAFGMFARVDAARGGPVVKTVNFPTAEMKVTGTFDYVAGDPSAPTGTFLRLTDLGNGNARIEGRMDGADRLWYTTGANPSLEVSWNVTVERVHGWYGQPEFEVPDHVKEVIQWNTWSHFSLPSGTITSGGVTEDVSPSKYRAYADMNWGGFFPEAPAKDPDNYQEYHWGWYALSTFSPANPLDDIAIVAGSGRTWTGFPFDEMKAQFGDFQLGQSCGLGPLCSSQAVQVYVDDHNVVQQKFQASTDGKVRTFTTTQDNWANFKDSFGEAKIPLSQTVTVQSDHLSVVMLFESTPDNYVRLLFPVSGGLFSDFEALGVNVTLTLANRTSTSHPWVTQSVTKIGGAGLEFGYHVPNGTDFLLLQQQQQ